MAITCVLGLFWGLTGCFGSVVESSLKRVEVTVVYEGYEESFNVSGELATVEDAFILLSKEYAEFVYKKQDSQYGAYIYSLCGGEQNESAGLYWSYYTDEVRELNGLPCAYEEYTYTYGGKAYYSCALGITEQAVFDGEHLIFVLAAV